MSERNPRIRRLANVTALLGIGLAGLLSETLYAGSGSDPCFRPKLEIYSMSTGTSPGVTGTATIQTTFKNPFIVEGASAAQGWLDLDSGAVGAQSAAGTSRFWTPACAGWSYRWLAKGSVMGQMKARTGRATNGSATAVCSFSASAAGDLAPPARDAKAVASTAGGQQTASTNLGFNLNGPTYGIGMNISSAQVTASTNAAGDANLLLDGPRSNKGAGPETLVVVNLYQYHSSQANGCLGAWAPHVSKSSASTGGYAGAAIQQFLFAKSPQGVEIGMGVHPQEGFWCNVVKMPNGEWSRGPWIAPFGPDFESKGPEVGTSAEPPGPPDASQRTENDGPYHRS